HVRSYISATLLLCLAESISTDSFRGVMQPRSDDTSEAGPTSVATRVSLALMQPVDNPVTIEKVTIASTSSSSTPRRSGGFGRSCGIQSSFHHHRIACKRDAHTCCLVWQPLL